MKKVILLSLMAFASPAVHALSVLEGTVNVMANEVVWANGSDNGFGGPVLAPDSNFFTQSTRALAPGLFLTHPYGNGEDFSEQSIVLVEENNPSLQSRPVKLRPIGAEFDISDYVANSSGVWLDPSVPYPDVNTSNMITTFGLFPAPNCPYGTPTFADGSGMMRVVGAGCYAKKVMYTKSSGTASGLLGRNPFTAYAPIIELDDAQVVSAFKELPRGTYSGSMTLQFYTTSDSGSGNVFMGAQRQSFDVKVTLVNNSVGISSIDIVGDGVMVGAAAGATEPDYDTNTQRVSAQTQYDITVNGYFENGLILTLDSNNQYQLASESNPSVTIHYSVTCTGCADTQVVNAGNPAISQTTLRDGFDGDTHIPFSLQFSYDVDGTTLVDGVYRDDFVFMVESDLL